MDQYSGASDDNTTIAIPNDNDVADSESVDAALRSLRDNTRLSFSVHSEHPIHQRVQLSCADTTTIQSQAVGGYIQQAQSFIPYSYLRGYRAADVFTVLDLDIPAPTVFEPSRIYYCYNVWDPAARTFKRRISTGFPDETLSVQKTDNFAHYLGAFLTDSSRRIVKYSKSQAYYTFDEQPDLISVTDTTPVTFDLTPIVPKYCSRVRLRVELYNKHATLTDFCRISASGTEQNLSIGPLGQTTAMLDLILRSKVLSARLYLGAVAAPFNAATITLDGMWES
jgi:hypothetical protein